MIFEIPAKIVRNSKKTLISHEILRILAIYIAQNKKCSRYDLSIRTHGNTLLLQIKRSLHELIPKIIIATVNDLAQSVQLDRIVYALLNKIDIERL